MKRTFADFEDKEKLACFSDENDKKPNEIAYASGKKYKFICNECKHVFEIEISCITRKKTQWCSYCVNKKLCKDENCKMCFDKSFASFDSQKVSCWIKEKNKRIIKSRDNKEIEVFIKPRDVFLNSNKKYWFKCKECDHHFDKVLFSAINGFWCQFCAKRELCKEENNCKKCFMKSFASFNDKDKVGSWSTTKNGKLKPCDVFMVSNKKRFFDCFKCGHEFDASIDHITRKNGTWCPRCGNHFNKNIEAIIEKLKAENIPYDLDTPIKIKGRNLFWDVQIKIDNENFHIESDGEQHFFLKNMMSISRTKDKEKGMKRLKCQRTRDLLKEDYIRNSGNLLFRISYRQRKEIPELIDEMVKRSKSGEKGVFYMDNIYWNKIEDQ